MTLSCRVVLVDCEPALLGIGAVPDAPRPPVAPCAAALAEWGVPPRAAVVQLTLEATVLQRALPHLLQTSPWRTRLCLQDGTQVLAIVEPRTETRLREADQAQLGAVLQSAMKTPAHEPAPSVGRSTVMLVEDDPVVRWVCRRILQDRFFVTEAGHGVDALSLRDWLPWRPDLLISDVNLPKMDGVALARRWLERDPAARVLLLSGSFFPEVAATLPVLFLQKPFQAQELLRCAEALLGALTPQHH